MTKQIQNIHRTSDKSKTPGMDGNKFFRVPPSEADNHPPHGMGEDAPTMGQYRDMAAGETVLYRIAKWLGW